jgi:hypothetical protein
VIPFIACNRWPCGSTRKAFWTLAEARLLDVGNAPCRPKVFREDCTRNCRAALGQYPLTLNYSHLTAIYSALTNFDHKYKLMSRSRCFHVVSHTNADVSMSCRTQMHHSVENLDSRFSWIKFFQKYKTKTASVYKKRQSQRYFGNQNWHTKPRRLTRLSQFRTPFVLTIHIRHIYSNVILLVFLGLQSRRFQWRFPPKFCIHSSVSHPLHMPTATQPPSCHSHNSGSPV